jgi:hypothetical protein
MQLKPLQLLLVYKVVYLITFIAGTFKSFFRRFPIITFGVFFKSLCWSGCVSATHPLIVNLIV